MKQLIQLSILLTLACIFTVRCANQAPPTGGPKDSIPPVVVRTTPHMYATNFKGKKMLIELDEYVKLKDQQKLFFVSPPGTQKPMLTVKGKSIEVLFENELDSATTYRLDFGSSIVDNNEDIPLDGYSLVFSTGPIVDSLVMAGQTIAAFERDSVINAYLFYFDAKADSLSVDSTLFNGKVEALFRTDSSGYFIADILKDKNYRIYALDDKNGNQRYEAGTDRVGFSERTFNPTELGGFTLTYDSVKKYMVIDSLQVKFELFKEIPRRRQLISKQERPSRQKILLTFNAIDAQIDSLALDGIDPSWIIREDGQSLDSITLWIAPPTKKDVTELVDTIKGSLVLQKQDSLWQPFSSKEKLMLTHRVFEPKKKKAESGVTNILKKRKKKGAKQTVDTTDSTTRVEKVDSIKKDEAKVANPFQIKTIADNPLNPEQNISFEFGYPLRSIDSSRIELVHIQRIEQKGRNVANTTPQTKEVKVPFTMFQSPENIRRWMLRAPWKVDEEYRLMIPSKVFEDITFEANDTLKSTFKIANPEKFGGLIFKTDVDTTDKSHYIFELVHGWGEKSTVAARQKDVKPGQSVTFSYLKAGVYTLRIVRDTNRNGKWDTGSLTERRQPEKVRMFTDGDVEPKSLTSKENWTVEEKVDLKKLFE